MTTTPDLHISADVLNRIAAEVHGAKVAALAAELDKLAADERDAAADHEGDGNPHIARDLYVAANRAAMCAKKIREALA